MRVKCESCGSYFDDVSTNCPHCGAVFIGSGRSEAAPPPAAETEPVNHTQPMTIEELQQWYVDRRLPSPEVSRFFIGEDYREPRAFGIYREEATGNFIVYKNKENGERAVRYCGTDEAYAVNEIFQRLKQEILQQKAAREYREGGQGTSARRKSKRGAGRFLKFFGIFIVIGFLVSTLPSIFRTVMENEPRQGYYSYEDTLYYYLNYESGGDEMDAWFSYDTGSEEWGTLWHEGEDKTAVPERLLKNRTAKHCFIQKEWDTNLGCTDVVGSIAYDDAVSGYAVDTGYYRYDDVIYYHMWSDSATGWYYYDDYYDDWYAVDEYALPDDLTHSYTAWDYYNYDGWDSSSQYTDFEDTDYYNDYYDDYGSTWDDDDDSDYDWYDDDDDWSSSSDWDSGWDSGSSDWDSDW